eukprot:3509167-Lingulodinium_polyedra.AAC.1
MSSILVGLPLAPSVNHPLYASCQEIATLAPISIGKSPIVRRILLHPRRILAIVIEEVALGH